MKARRMRCDDVISDIISVILEKDLAKSADY